MFISELVKKINSYRHEVGGIQQEFPFEVDFVGMDEEDKDVLILQSGRLRFAEYVTREFLGQWELVCGANSNISTNGHDPGTLEVLTADEADAVWSILRRQVAEILEEVQ